MPDTHFEIIQQLLSGNRLPPVCERTTAERSALTKYYRNRLNYKLVGTYLYYDNKNIVKTSDVTKLVKEQYDRRRGIGPRRMHHSLKNEMCLSEHAISHVLSQDTRHQIMTARFLNKAPHTSIRSRGVQDKLQIDLVDMTRSKILYADTAYSYVLCVLDVFSRYTWLRPLPNKKSSTVMVRLKDILELYGYPRLVQHDCGTEFRKHVKRWLKNKHVTVRTSRPYHPQSQGKIERMNQILKKQIAFDLVKYNQLGINWVRQLPSYEK